MGRLLFSKMGNGLSSIHYFCRMYLYFFPVIAALLGTLGNLTFVNYLFRKIIPAKTPTLAAAAGKYVSGNLLQLDKLTSGLADPEKLAALRPTIEHHIDVFLKEKLKEKMPAIAMFIGEKTIDMMKKSLMDEIDLLLPNLLGQYLGNIGDRINVEKILAAKLAALPEEKITALLQQHLKKEKRMFLLFGAVCGFLTGLVLMALALLQR
jgi:uncharacterized membrane protein YheB (UPF0754 family)